MPRNIVLLILLLLPSQCFTQSSEVIFRRNGAGLWVQQGEKTELIVIMEMRRERSNQLTLTVRPINGIPRRFTGTMSEHDPSGYYVAIASSAKEKASGTIYVENDAAKSVQFVIGYADVRGRRIAFHFTTQRPLRTNALVLGSGTFVSASLESKILAASILTSMSGRSEVSFVLEDGTVRRFKVTAPKETLNNSAAKAELDFAEGTTGSITVERDRTKYQVKKTEGRGELETEQFSFSFDANPQVP